MGQVASLLDAALSPYAPPTRTWCYKHKECV